MSGHLIEPKEGWWRMRDGGLAEIGYVHEEDDEDKGRMYGISWGQPGSIGGYSEKWGPTGHVRFWGNSPHVAPEECDADLVEYLGTDVPVPGPG